MKDIHEWRKEGTEVGRIEGRGREGRELLYGELLAIFTLPGTSMLACSHGSQRRPSVMAFPDNQSGTAALDLNLGPVEVHSQLFVLLDC